MFAPISQIFYNIYVSPKLPKFSLPKIAFPKKTKTGFLVLDIGTEAVKAVLFQLTKEGIEAHGFAREPHNVGDVQRGGVTDFAGVLTTVERAIASVEKVSGIQSEEVIVVMGNDFLNALPVVFQERRVNPKLKINEVELKNIFHKIYAKSLEKIRAHFLQEGLQMSHELKIVDAYIQDVKIDGYDIDDPLGLDGKVISFNVFYSFLFPSSQEILNQLASILKKRIREIYTPSFSVSAVLRKDLYPLSDFITIDIGGAVTEIALTRKGMVAGTKNFQVGGHTITQRIAGDLGIGFWEAEDIKLAYSNKKLSSYVSKKIKDTVKRDVDLWRSGLELALKEISFLNILPGDLFVYGAASGFVDFSDVLHKTDLYRQLPFSGKPKFNFLDARSIKGLTFSSPGDASSTDIVPYVACRMFKDRMKRSHLQDIFETIIRVMQK